MTENEPQQPSCKMCVRFATCKYVEKAKELHKGVFSMFEHLEWNNVDELFYQSAKWCKYYIHQEESIDKLKKRIATARFQLYWLKDHAERWTGDPAEYKKIVERVLGEYHEAISRPL